MRSSIVPALTVCLCLCAVNLSAAGPAEMSPPGIEGMTTLSPEQLADMDQFRRSNALVGQLHVTDAKSHQKLLTDEQLRLLVTWFDIQAPYFDTYMQQVRRGRDRALERVRLDPWEPFGPLREHTIHRPGPLEQANAKQPSAAVTLTKAPPGNLPRGAFCYSVSGCPACCSRQAPGLRPVLRLNRREK